MENNAAFVNEELLVEPQEDDQAHGGIHDDRSCPATAAAAHAGVNMSPPRKRQQAEIQLYQIVPVQAEPIVRSSASAYGDQAEPSARSSTSACGIHLEGLQPASKAASTCTSQTSAQRGSLAWPASLLLLYNNPSAGDQEQQWCDALLANPSAGDQEQQWCNALLANPSANLDPIAAFSVADDNQLLHCYDTVDATSQISCIVSTPHTDAAAGTGTALACLVKGLGYFNSSISFPVTLMDTSASL
jgi:hypothetical protein